METKEAKKDDELVDVLDVSFDCKQRAVRAVRFNADGNYCLTCGSDKSIKLWNPHTNMQLKTYSGHGAEVLDVCGSYDNSLISSCGQDKTVVIIEVATGKIQRKYRGHAGCVNCVEFNEEASVVFSGSIDGTIRAWDCRSRSQDPIQVMDEAKDSVTSIKVVAHEILAASADNRIRRYDLRNGQMMVDYIGESVTCATFTRDVQCILVSTLDSTLRLMDKDSGELLNDYKGHKNTEYKIDSCISSSDRYVLSGSEDGKVYVWDLVSGNLVRQLDHQAGAVVHSLSFHPTENLLLSASKNKVYLWKSASQD